jgi:hypothetical protein
MNYLQNMLNYWNWRIVWMKKLFKIHYLSLEEAIEDKVENTAKLVRCLDADIEAIKKKKSV